MISLQEQNACAVNSLLSLQTEREEYGAQAVTTAFPTVPFADTLPTQLPASLTITHLLTSRRNSADGEIPTIDAVFSKKNQEASDEAEGAHVIFAGETLYLYGSNLPTQATAMLEAQNNPFRSCLELEAYGWNTLKSVRLPDRLCEGDYRLTLVGKDGSARSNSVFITVLPIHAPEYISLFKGLKCLHTAKAHHADYPYLLGVAADSQGWKTVSSGAYPQIGNNTRVGADLRMGGAHDATGLALPVTEPGKSLFHIGLGSANNFRYGWMGKQWDMDSYDVLTPDAWGRHKTAELWSRIVTDRTFLGQHDLTQSELSCTLKECICETIGGCGEDTLLGMTTLTWTREEVETARKINGEQDVVKFLDVRCGQAHYRLEFHLRRIHR